MAFQKGLCCLMVIILLAPSNVYPEEFAIYLTGDVDFIGCENAEKGGQFKCPESEGYFTISGSSQCFRHNSDTPRSWDDAKAWCESQGLVLPKPEENILRELSLYLDGVPCRRYPCYVWVGGRGSDNDAMIWERDGSELEKSKPVWKNGVPLNLHSNRCLGFFPRDPGYKNPYVNYPCDEKKQVTLCEAI